MDGARLRDMRRIAATLLAGLLASAVHVQAATTVRTVTGGAMTVEETGASVRAGAHRGEARALTFTWQDAVGTRNGIVGPTADLAVDHSPVLTLDPRSGRPVLIWSRWDGTSMKLAWSRFDGDRWTDARFLTFGPGNDLSPAVGTSSAGSYLFWKNEQNQFFYAPIDLGTGRLFAAPALVGAAESPVASVTTRLRPEGSSDVPIILGGCDPNHPETCTDPGGGGAGSGSGVIKPEGGSDVPIIICGPTSGVECDPPKTNIYSQVELVVASDALCASQVLVMASEHGRQLHAVEFLGGGRTRTLDRMAIHPGTDPLAAATAFGSRLLESICE